MPTLRALLAAHAPLLVIDAASTRVQVGWLPGPDLAAAAWESSEEEAGVGVFRCLERLAVQNASDAAAAFVFCEGPGSILGIRTVAMALRTWSILRPRPAFAYHSLALVAHSQPERDLTVIADARRDSWHLYRKGEALCRVPTAALAGDLVMPDGFRNWTQLPSGVGRANYTVATLLPAVIDMDLFEPTSAPDAFLHEEPDYVTWQPKIHRGKTDGSR